MTVTAPARILIVEDEWIIAATLQDILEAEGFSVQGPAGNVADAIKIIEQSELDGAVLDVSLRGETSFAVARELSARSVPFIFMTGYVTTDLPAEFKDRPILNKPVNDQRLIRSVKNSLADRLHISQP